jgi:hypothetical protein
VLLWERKAVIRVVDNGYGHSLGQCWNNMVFN